MNVEIKRASFEVSQEEAIDLFYALRRDLEHTIDTHWCYHPGVYSQQSNAKLQMMRELSRMFGYDQYHATVADLNIRLELAVKKLEGAK